MTVVTVCSVIGAFLHIYHASHQVTSSPLLHRCVNLCTVFQLSITRPSPRPRPVGYCFQSRVFVTLLRRWSVCSSVSYKHYRKLFTATSPNVHTSRATASVLDHDIKFARWQHPARAARLAPCTCQM